MRALPSALILLCVVIHCAFGSDPPARLSAEDRKLFAWFDRLGIEDFTQAQLVRVRVENTGPNARFVEEPTKDEPRAFLLFEKDGRFRFLLGDLTTAILERHGTDPGERGYVGWRATSLDDEAKSLLEALDRLNSGWDPTYLDGHTSSQDLLELRAQAFVLARYALAHEREDLAAHLMRAARRLMRKARGTPAFEEGLQTDIGGALIYRATLALADGRQDRRALAAQFQNVVDRCPRANFAQAAALADALRKMAVEDDAHPKIGEAELAKLTPEAQARELVFRLRDEYCDGQDSWTRPWPFEPRENRSFRQLVDLGSLAVPALLEALGDDRPSRTIHCWGGAFLGISSVSIQSLAGKVLAEISGVDFEWMADVGENFRPVQRLAQDWWQTTQEKGEVEWFRTQITTGPAHGARICLDALARRHLETLPQFLPAIVPTTADVFLRSRMIDLLTPTDSPEINAFLLEQLAHGQTRTDRVAAAYVLRQHHQPEALAAMLAELAALRPVLPESKAQDRLVSDIPSATLDNPSDPDTPEHVLHFLLSCDSPLAVQEVGAILPQCPPALRADIIEVCVQRLSRLGEAHIEPAGPATRHAIEALLVSELHEKAAQGAQKLSLADIAAQALAACWPAKYHFDVTAPPAARAAQIATIRATFEARPAPPGTENKKDR